MNEDRSTITSSAASGAVSSTGSFMNVGGLVGANTNGSTSRPRRRAVRCPRAALSLPRRTSGRNDNASTLTGSSATGSMTAVTFTPVGSQIGGLVGVNSSGSTISSSTASGTCLLRWCCDAGGRPRRLQQYSKHEHADGVFRDRFRKRGNRLHYDRRPGRREQLRFNHRVLDRERHCILGRRRDAGRRPRRIQQHQAAPVRRARSSSRRRPAPSSWVPGLPPSVASWGRTPRAIRSRNPSRRAPCLRQVPPMSGASSGSAPAASPPRSGTRKRPVRRRAPAARAPWE